MRYIIFFITLLICINKSSLSEQQDGDFNIWLDNLKIEAKNKGISQETIEESFANVKLLPRVIELDRKQPEFTLTLSQYLNRVVTKNKIKKGISKMRENWSLIEEIYEKYEVQPRFFIALWGIETDYGRVSGGFSVINSLTTLAYDGRRSKYFRKELINALKIIDEGHIDYENMYGSWAGAMGQPQFMPSSFLSYSVDFDEDGRKNIWTSKEDALASAANYLANLKWNKNETWGREVSVTDDFNLDPSLLTLDNKKYLNEWQTLGVRRLDGTDLPKRDVYAYLLAINDKNNYRYFIVYQNFKRILRWNTSNYFAIAVGMLSDAISIN